MVQILKKISALIFPFLLLATVVFLAFKNFTPGSTLIGWDSLHPEFNFPLAFQRAFNGVFRAEQGVGAVAAHSHMADLPRILILWLGSFVLPVSFLRYGYLFLCLALGPLGVYFLLNHTLNKGKSLLGFLASFLGGAFYLLNLVTLQHFIVPFEMFAVQYAFLPFLILFSIKFLDRGKKGSLILFSLFIFLSSPMAYAATLFWAFLGAYLIFLTVYTVGSSTKLVTFKRSLILIVIVVGLNLFWILPNIYSGLNQSQIIENSKINTLFSPEAFIRNESYGNAKDILLGKNFLFEWRVLDFNSNSFVDLMNPWNIHLGNTNILTLGYILGGLVALGALLALVKGGKLGWSMFFIYIYSLFFLLNTNPPVGAFYSYLNQHFGILKEALRMPFTKFSILFEFCSAFFVGFLFFQIFAFFKKLKVANFLGTLTTIVVFGYLLIFMKPAFEGHFISPVVRNNLPAEYQELFDWFRNNSEGRVAKLPLNSLWGWEYHSWGYEGSGFLSFGIPNPILDRDFDRWSGANESFYNQASFALYSEDLTAFENTLQKYQVKYLLLDESIINAGGSSEYLHIPQIKEMLSKSGHIKLSNTFGFLTVYETDWDFGVEGITIPQQITRINTDLTYAIWDPVYPLIGNYYEKEGGVTFPFANFDPRGKVAIKEEGLNIVFRSGGVIASLPSTGKISEDFSQRRGFPEAFNCDLKKVGVVTKDNDGQKITYTAKDGGVSCDFFTFEDLKYKEGYVLRVKGENKGGRSLKIYLFNQITGRMDLEELMPQGMFDQYFVVYPKEIEGSGYSLNLETRSFGKVSSENILEKIEFIPAPISWLSTLKGEGPEEKSEINNLTVIKQQNITPYLLKLDVQGGGLIQFDQGFEEGWVSFSKQANIVKTIQNKLPQVRINSWANGWIVPDETSEIYIIFWPQLLEFGGMMVGLLTLVVVTFGKKKPETTLSN
jgi:hypothetical protein